MELLTGLLDGIPGSDEDDTATLASANLKKASGRRSAALCHLRIATRRPLSINTANFARIASDLAEDVQ